MIFTVRHKLDEEQEARLERRLDGLTDFDEILNETAEKIQHVWVLSLIGTGVVAFGLGIAVGRLTQKET